MNSNIFLAVTFAVTLVAAFIFLNPLNKKDGIAKNGWERKAELETPTKMAGLAAAPVRVKKWPPVHGQRFPDVDLFDHEGKKFSIASLPDKPTLIEFIAMSCAGCQAFAGGNKYGGFEGFACQADLKSADEYFKQFTGHDLHSADINFVQIIFYDLQLESPSPEELAAWRKHFRLDRHPNTFVVSGGDALANKASYAMIPGFLLLDANRVIQYDSTGHHPKHGFYTELLPAAKKMLDQ